MFTNILDYVRIALYVLLAIIGFYLFQAWEADHQPVPTAVSVPVGNQTESTAPMISNIQGSAPTIAANTATTQTNTSVHTMTGKLVSVNTDKLALIIDTRGGDIVQAALLDYPESMNNKTPFVLLNNDDKTRYIAESGLLSQRGPDTSQEQALYTASQDTYVLPEGENDLKVNLTWESNGLKVIKTFTFVRGSYEVGVNYTIQNQSSQNWEGNLYTQLLRTDSPPVSQGGLVNLATFFGAAVSTPDKPFQKITFKQMQEGNFNMQATGGWVAMIQHYFISAWIPQNGTTSNYYTQVMSNGLYAVGMLGPKITVAPGAAASAAAKLYAGPAITDTLEKAAPNLKLTIDYGWFWFISGIIFWMMQKIYDVVGNWGWSIVIVTIIIKLLFYHLSAKSYRSMSGLKKLQPRIELLKERYGDDKQKLTQATLELYRQEKVNPMSGCLPILIQIPVFIALYWVLVESVELRHAPFILWIRDLSQHDPYYILPLLMGASMFIQQRLNPPPPDPLQAKVMMLMPVIFTVLFANFPAGLMLYWFVNNTLSFMQQWYVMRSIK